MEIKRKKIRKKKIHTVFLAYLVIFLGQSVLLAGVAFIALNIMVNTGFLLPAVHTLHEIEAVSEDIEKSKRVEKELIPDGATYGVYGVDGSYLYGDFSEKEQKQAWKNKESDDTQIAMNTFYTFIPRSSGETCIIHYAMLAQFSSPALRKHLPNAEHIFLAVVIALFFIQTAWTARRFGRYLSKRLETLNKVTDTIKESNLEFEREYSDIREIDQVLESLFTMKEELRKSLETQWESEEIKKEQIAALAHDIKTPLTVIRGNAELIHETTDSADIREYDQYVTESVKEIEDYLIVLQETLRSGSSGPEEARRLDAAEFVKRIADRADNLGKGKKIRTTASINTKVVFICVQEEKLYRAFMNIISNAVEYTPEGGDIFIEADIVSEEDEGEKAYVEITVTDSGPGYTKEELDAAARQFFQGDASRHKKGHYGMGLYIAESFIEQQGGTLALKNVSEEGGARVRVRVPLAGVKFKAEPLPEADSSLQSPSMI